MSVAFYALLLFYLHADPFKNWYQVIIYTTTLPALEQLCQSSLVNIQYLIKTAVIHICFKYTFVQKYSVPA